MKRWWCVGTAFVVACSGSPVILENVVGSDAGSTSDAGSASDSGVIGTRDAYVPSPDDASTEADGRACFVYALATGTPGTSCEPIGTGQPNPGCGDSCSPINVGYMCTDGPPPLAGVRSGGTAYTYCSDQNAWMRDSEKDSICTDAHFVDAGRLYAWAAAAKPDDPNNAIATPPHDTCQGAQEAPGLVFNCCPFETP